MDYDTTTQIAAVVAAASGLIAAIAGIWNLVLAAHAEPTSASPFSPASSPQTPMAIERYIEVVVVNGKPRPNSVVKSVCACEGRAKPGKKPMVRPNPSYQPSSKTAKS